MKTFFLVCAALPIAAAAPAMESDTREDVRCFSALMVAGDSEDEGQLTAVTIVAQYYLGRIDARSPGLDLEEAIVAETQGMSPTDMADLLRRCSERVEKRGQELIDLGKRIELRGAAIGLPTS